MYVAQTQFPTRAMNVVVRTSVEDPAAVAPAAARQIREIDPDLPIYNVRPMEARVSESLARRRFSMLLLTGFALLALGLAAIGTYGVIAYLVSQGTRELGIRMALGAAPAAVLWLVVRQGALMGLGGVALGIAGAFLMTPLMRSLLFGVAAADLLTFGAIALLLTIVALAASYVPARRASRIDPVVSLRTE
jgi:ABC-type antimicrobial peptide transport system permease subunit